MHRRASGRVSVGRLASVQLLYEEALDEVGDEEEGRTADHATALGMAEGNDATPRSPLLATPPFARSTSSLGTMPWMFTSPGTMESINGDSGCGHKSEDETSCPDPILPFFWLCRLFGVYAPPDDPKYSFRMKVYCVVVIVGMAVFLLAEFIGLCDCLGDFRLVTGSDVSGMRFRRAFAFSVGMACFLLVVLHHPQVSPREFTFRLWLTAVITNCIPLLSNIATTIILRHNECVALLSLVGRRGDDVMWLRRNTRIACACAVAGVVLTTLGCTLAGAYYDFDLRHAGPGQVASVVLNIVLVTYSSAQLLLAATAFAVCNDAACAVVDAFVHHVASTRPPLRVLRRELHSVLELSHAVSKLWAPFWMGLVFLAMSALGSQMVKFVTGGGRFVILWPLMVMAQVLAVVVVGLYKAGQHTRACRDILVALSILQERGYRGDVTSERMAAFIEYARTTHTFGVRFYGLVITQAWLGRFMYVLLYAGVLVIRFVY